MRILVDNSVLRDAIVAEFDTRPHSAIWGGHEEVTKVAMMRRRPLPPTDQAARRKAILTLPTVVRLAREKKFDLVTYEELNWERAHGRNPAVATRGDLFARVEMPHVEPAVSRSFFQQSLIEDYWTKEALTKFCKFLLNLDANAIELAASRKNLPSKSAQSLRDLKRFKELCRHAHEGHLTDLFHLWTGERNGCEHFLTMEKRMCNWIRARPNDTTRCAPVRPNELLNILGITDLDPMPFEEGSALDYFRAVDLSDE